MALHAVEENRESSSVRLDPQWTQRTAICISTGPGGAIPASASLARPSGVIMSVDQAGLSTVSTKASGNPASSSARVTSDRIASMAGQPEYVGVIVTVIRPEVDRDTDRRMP